MTPIEELRPHLGNTVEVRVLNVLTWSGIEYVEEIVGWRDDEITNLVRIAQKNSHINCSLGWKSRSSLKKAIAKVMEGKERGDVPIKLENFLTSIAIKEIYDEKEEKQFVLEFEIQLGGKKTKFQSHPMGHDQALRLNSAINEWSLEYNQIRRRVGMLHEALIGVTKVVDQANRKLKDA